MNRIPSKIFVFAPDGQWSTYESNVQAYRSNFLSSQSILLAVGAIVLEQKSFLVFIIVFLLAIVQIWYIWVRAIIVRCCIVDFHKFNMSTLFDKDGNCVSNPSEPLREKDYATITRTRKKVNDGMTKMMGEKFVNIRLTRFKFDILIPAMMTIIWCAFALYLLSEKYGI